MRNVVSETVLGETVITMSRVDVTSCDTATLPLARHWLCSLMHITVPTGWLLLPMAYKYTGFT
jgi:hypothetical protein